MFLISFFLLLTATRLSLPHAQPILSLSYNLLHLKSQKPTLSLQIAFPRLINQLAARIGTNTPSPNNHLTHPHLVRAALLLYVGSQMPLSTATSLLDLVVFNVPMMPRPLL
jgi:hypothetical protein